VPDQVQPTPGSGAPVATPPAPQWYRAVVGSELQEVPFFLSAPPPATPGGCVIVNGDERLEVPCSWSNDAKLVIEFPMFATTIQAARAVDGALTGTWEMSRLFGIEPARFAATRVAGPDPALRFPAPPPAVPPPAPTADFAGTWKFQFAAFESGKGLLSQSADGIVTGTIIQQSIGDMRYMAGNARGNSLLLSTFDGQHAYVVRAELDPSGALAGTWIYSSVLTDRFTAQRVATMDMAKVEKIRLRPGKRKVTIPQLDDPRFLGKPVIVDYFGTWCPACMDQTPFLVELYKRHHADGLEILSLAVEGTTDDAYNQTQVEYFRKRYAVPWPIVVLPSDDYTQSERLLPPELEGTGGYPITIFIDRDRTVRAVHSGFYGPAAGDDHHRLVKKFERYVAELLASPPAR